MFVINVESASGYGRYGYDIALFMILFHYMSGFFLIHTHTHTPRPSTRFLFGLHFFLSARQIIIGTHLAQPPSARHTMYGITLFCQAASQWHHLTHTLFCPQRHVDLFTQHATDLFYKQPRQKQRGAQRCQPASQTTDQPACQPSTALFLDWAVKPICWRQH